MKPTALLLKETLDARWDESKDESDSDWNKIEEAEVRQSQSWWPFAVDGPLQVDHNYCAWTTEAPEQVKSLIHEV